MYTRQFTPPSVSYSSYLTASAHSRSTSDGSFYSSDASPGSVGTNITTPPRSPIRQHGTTLLPKVRQQDQVTEPTAGPTGAIRHRKTMSASSAAYIQTVNPYGARPSSYYRRGASPGEQSNIVSPISEPSPYETSFSNLNSPVTFGPALSRRPSISHSRSQSASRSHHRAESAGSIDESIISRYGYPTYRQMPVYTTSATPPPPAMHISNAVPVNSYNSIESWSQDTYAQDYQRSEYTPAPAVQYSSTVSPVDSFTLSTSTTTMLAYLTAPNPSPALVRRVTTTGRGMNSYFWWDIRNLRQWTDFTVEKISEVPDLMKLLQFPVSTATLPTPPRPNLQPDSEGALHDICRDYHAQKVNSALRMALGDPNMTIRSFKPAPGSRQPDFVSNYSFDYEKTLLGDGRGRVVGLVKSYDQWNTGMRSEAPNKQVYYLQGLAHLHKIMRDHGCRYGFIMTEIEVLCVRAGGPPDSGMTDSTTVNSSGSVPLFGYLELSAPIRLSTNGFHPETGEAQLTAGLALWYLHMLAKENPLPGAISWRMEVGGPPALTRQNVIEKDAWIPKPNIGEKRDAKRIRGWVFPEEPYNRKESGKPRRVRKA
ncbi:hypothetical protein EJ05DRAFT_497721 [Pseudovirgaria hyperparasitica]|uniref:Sialidase n=1 Tax=Pseudovirgaria hyperparasitica TaxID=470096 RepID=A0A6A6WGG6_9PEZI|nr:uncharacterized protein EJ05DRAFT_497721 [Pseudovirgaria hyperparasitica]KAF2761164.1 hypothetical protein EJ05DRAFT_497721 [Pseudovirgaria hyperparasitica]